MDAKADGDQRLVAASDDGEAALRAWLPPASELLYSAQREWHFYALMRGAAHPALLCASLYGRRWACRAAWCLRAQRRLFIGSSHIYRRFIGH